MAPEAAVIVTVLVALAPVTGVITTRSVNVSSASSNVTGAETPAPSAATASPRLA